MKKYEEPQKITALGVVIFSFISLVVGAAIFLVISTISVLLVLKTSLPESFLRIGSVISSGVALIAATAILTAKARIKGIVASLIIAVVVIGFKIVGNMLMNMGGYLTFNGLIGIFFTLLFALSGGVIGSHLKR